ncbi:MAG TPA: alpha/beta fold hydrolase [Acidimicrobiales bacterium]|nr:alpha/beta fold hydrolase [Acidimicrobiales bacterium]
MPTLDRHGISIVYQVHGPSLRTPLLLTHGYSATSAMWEANVAALSAAREVVTWDLRGHGHSDSPDDGAAYSRATAVGDMAAILDDCGLSRAVVGGLSLGGYLSLAFHLRHPERVAGLVLCDTGPGFARDEPRSQWNTWAEATADAFEQTGLEALAGGPETMTGPHNPTGLALAARGMLRQDDAAVIESLPSIAVPTLVVVGAEDRPFLRSADYLAAKIPGARKAVIRRAGHVPNVENPSDFNDVVRAFLDEVG